jgi:hypothetical protein
MYFPRNWEFGSALPKLQNFGGGGGVEPPAHRYATAHTYKSVVGGRDLRPSYWVHGTKGPWWRKRMGRSVIMLEWGCRPHTVGQCEVTVTVRKNVHCLQSTWEQTSDFEKPRIAQSASLWTTNKKPWSGSLQRKDIFPPPKRSDRLEPTQSPIHLLSRGSCGFGGLVVSMLASGTQDSGFRTRPKPSDFSGEKIHSMPSFGGEVKPSAPCRRFAACKKTPAIYVEVGIAGKIYRPLLAQFRHSPTEVSYVAWRGAPLEMTGGTEGGAQRANSLRPRCVWEVDLETATRIYLRGSSSDTKADVA